MADLSEREPKGSAFAARAAVISAVLLTMIAIGSVGWRWYHVRFPNSALFVRGTEAVAGAEVIISNDDGYEIYRGYLTAPTSYQVVALVEQGIYSIAVRREGATLVNDRMYVPNGSGVLVKVIRDEAAGQPATAPSRMTGERGLAAPATTRAALRD